MFGPNSATLSEDFFSFPLRFALFERFVLSLWIVDEIKAELFAVLSEKMRAPISVRRSKKDS